MNPSSLDPAIYLSPASALAWSGGERVEMRNLVKEEIIEGKRDRSSAEKAEETVPVYRQANLGTLRWKLDSQHWKQPAAADRTCVLPGDIVINKLAPVRASIATSRLHRHPVDANCYLLRGMERPVALWVALCLNQPVYAEYLVRLAGGSILPRVTMRALRELPLLFPPAEPRNLAEKTWALVDGFLAEEENLYRVISEAQDRICPPETARFWRERLASVSKLTWWRRIPSAVVSDSLVPGHSLFELLCHELESELGWIPLEQCLAPKQPPRARLSAADETATEFNLRCLRISDVGTDLTVARTPHKEKVAWPGRVYGQPLRNEEVLVSLLVSSPTVAYAGEIPRTDIFVTDHWDRLLFRETPGAWAMILSSPLVSVQLRLLAQGSARQFLSSGAVGRVLVPVPPREERLAWDRSLLTYQRKRLDLETAWGSLWNELATMFDQIHRDAGVAITLGSETHQGGFAV